MTKALNILFLEDSDQESLLVALQLKHAGYTVDYRRVQTAEELEVTLLERNWDFVLADLTLPQYNGLDGLRLSKRLRPELPVIVHSGEFDDDIAIEALQAGATDYVPKGNHGRLLLAIARAVQHK